MPFEQSLPFSLVSLFVLAASLMAFCMGWLLRRNDEFPLFLCSFTLLFFWRLKMLATGEASWVEYDYGITFRFDLASGIRVGYYMLLGTTLIIVTYCWRRKQIRRRSTPRLSFTFFLFRYRFLLIIGFLLFSAASIAFHSSFKSEDVLSMGSYVFLATLANSSFILLLFMLARETGKTVIHRLLFAVLILVGLYSGFSSSLRFQFLGWAVAAVIIATARLRPLTKLGVFVACGVLGGFGFALMGLFRYEGAHEATFAQLADVAANSLSEGSDYNMIDGFVMSEQVFPAQLPFQRGMEHIEILARPIPRALWPSKPMGGWQQKFGQTQGGIEFGTGISPSLYGSFYEEGGVVAIVIFSVLYGWMFAAIVNAADCFADDLKWLLRGILAASLFALIRGGDLPGIAAFIGMSYWPVFLLFGMYRVLVWQPWKRMVAHTASRVPIPAARMKVGPSQSL